MASKNETAVDDKPEVVVEEKKTTTAKTVAVRFINPHVDSRSISKNDFKRHKVTVDSDYVWDRENDFTVDASPEAAEFLATLPEFEVK